MENKYSPEQEISVADKIRGGLRGQRFRYGTLATIFTIVVVAAVIMLNVVISILTNYFGINFDMTSEKRMSISKETVEILNKLEKDITFNVIMNEEDFRAEIYGNEMAEIMQKYEVSSNGKVKVNYVDPLRNPTFVKTYEADISIGRGDIIVQDENDKSNYVFIENDDLYYWYDSAKSSISGVYIERRLTNAVVSLQTKVEELPYAAVMTGHGEYNTSYLGELLSQANYQVVYINPMYYDIPEEISLLILSAPSTDYTEDEVDKLEKYISEGKNFIFIHSSTITKLTNLELLFREYGVAYENAIVCDALYRVNNNYANIITSVASNLESDLVTNLDSTQRVVMPYARVMRLLWTSKDRYTSKIILETSNYSYGKVITPGVPLKTYEPETGDLAGNFPTVIHVSAMEDGNGKSGNLLFISSASIFDDSLLSTESYGNMQFLTNVLARFNKASTTVSITAKKYTDPELNVAGNLRNVVLVLLLIIPIAVLAFGIVVWQRRKNR